jgi:hypothetical protein
MRLSRFKKTTASTIACAATLALLGGRAATAQTLYNGNAGGTPASQGWFVLGNVNPATGVPVATETYDAVNAVTKLDSTASSSIYAGYSNYNALPNATPSGFSPTTLVNSQFPTLDRAAGFTVSFTMQLASQANTNPARAGFSVLVLDKDRLGVEIGFHTADLFALQLTPNANPALPPQFTVAESNADAAIAGLTQALTAYDLRIQGNTYALRSGNTTLLTGALKDYTTAQGFGTDVYRTPNFLFLGDDTTSASADLRLRSVTLAVSAPEPTSAAFALTAMAAGIGVTRVRRRRAD